ncbi:MAG: tryptophan synthase subunit alpha [Spirochaetes bacterium]|nr:tryptophan synthase subunit alpha [Spirochaetota bacterium]
MKSYNGAYLVADYPDRERFISAALKSLEFFDFLEIGIPFSDPVSDGTVIAKAAYDVIESGVKFNDIMKSIDEIKSKIPADRKLYVMTYANHIYHRGIQNFGKIMNDHGISGMIIPDIPFIESRRFTDIFEQQGLEFIYFITPESKPEQIKQIAQSAKGFIYSVSMRGITGSSMNLKADIKTAVADAKTQTKVPVVLGFGIRDVESCKNALETADGFIIGTRMIELLNEDADNSSFNKFVEELKAKF